MSWAERVVARFTGELAREEERRALAREEAERQIGNWYRLTEIGNEHHAEGRPGSAFSFWRQAGVAEWKASEATKEAGGNGWV